MENEVVLEKLCRKMPCIRLGAEIVKQNQEKIQQVELVRFRKPSEQLTEGERV